MTQQIENPKALYLAPFCEFCDTDEYVVFGEEGRMWSYGVPWETDCTVCGKEMKVPRYELTGEI